MPRNESLEWKISIFSLCDIFVPRICADENYNRLKTKRPSLQNDNQINFSVERKLQTRISDNDVLS